MVPIEALSLCDLGGLGGVFDTFTIEALGLGGLGGGEASLFNQHPERPTHNSLKPYGTT